MSEIFNFVDKKLIDIKPPNKGQVMYRDEKEKGLVLRVSYGGNKVFYLYKRFDGRPRLIKVGNFPKISITNARIAVRNLKTKIERGEYNTKEKAIPKGLSFKQLFDKYINGFCRICFGFLLFAIKYKALGAMRPLTLQNSQKQKLYH